jgi:hydroxymethylpyrimidine/phosphomethylpyrimidine kinase
MLPIVFSIAGSDCSGGAGIQADLKTISALGGYAAAAVTAVTVQNTMGVQDVHPVPAPVIEAQIDAVMSDLHPHAVKIGMMTDEACVAAIARALSRQRAAASTMPATVTQNPFFIVCDPVMISTSGRQLLSADAVDCLTRTLFPLCTLITPNLPEAEALLGERLTSIAAMEQGGSTLAARYGCSVLIKGGHLNGNDMCDVLTYRHTADSEGGSAPDVTYTLHHFTAQRIASGNLHGTGCTLSSAIATHLAFGCPLPQAVSQAKSYVHDAIERGRNLHIGHGNGPLGHFVIQ